MENGFRGPILTPILFLVVLLAVILHNGTPIHNLAVSAIYQGANGPFTTGTTDGSGLFIVHPNLANAQSTILYDFSINGTGYSFSGSATGIITVNV
jgi:hypothetical protein